MILDPATTPRSDLYAFLIRAIAPHSGGTYPGSCPGGPIPVMIWHGSADFLIDPNCGRNARDVWVERNGCQSTFDTVPVTVRVLLGSNSPATE